MRKRFTRGLLAGILAASAIVAQQNQFQGSVARGAVSATPLALTLHDAIDRGLKANLGLLVRDSTSESVRGQRLQALSAPLPQLHAQAGETIEQINLKTIGFNFTIPGAAIPSIVGPFHYTDVRAYASWDAYDAGSARAPPASPAPAKAPRLKRSTRAARPFPGDPYTEGLAR